MYYIMTQKSNSRPDKILDIVNIKHEVIKDCIALEPMPDRKPGTQGGLTISVVSEKWNCLCVCVEEDNKMNYLCACFRFVALFGQML